MRLPLKLSSSLLVGCVLTVWIFALRWPYFDRPAWNLDEGIHATIARTLLDGGVMYRDAIDQRTPLTYHIVAGVFRIFGENNMWALHFLLAGLVAGTALGVYRLGRLWRGPAAGIWAALVFCAATTNLLYIGDTHSLSTEWFVIFFTTWSACWFWQLWEKPTLGRAALAGVGFACAFLSKQPGLLDFGAPLATVLLTAGLGRLERATATRLILGLCAGFVGTTALMLGWYWWQGALGDLYFYAWSYNLVYYGPETSFLDRAQAAWAGAQMWWEYYPIIGLIALAGLARLGFDFVQRRPTEEEQRIRPAAFYLLAWTALAWAGASSAGRVYGHYYIQTFPAFSLLVGWTLADLQSWWTAPRHLFWKITGALALAAAAWTVTAGPLRGPWPATLGPEAGTDEAKFVRMNSRPEDKIFVWGYSPDFYLLADRRSASRFVYCSFLTGLIPWTNVAPDRDTSYGIVPGTMTTLLKELEATRPEFFVDGSPGTYRHFNKYPLAKFPALAAWVSRWYVELDPEQFRAHGFRVLKLKDGARSASPALAGGPAGGKFDMPFLSGNVVTNPVPVEYLASSVHAQGKLQRLELLIDDQLADSVTFAPVPSMKARFAVDFGRIGKGKHQLVVRATAASGETQLSQVLTVECAPESLPAEQRAGFALPLHVTGPAPKFFTAPFGAMAREEAGRMVFFAHAPATMLYPLPPGSQRLRGGFGFRPGAYAASNAGHTDGAEFIITWIHPVSGVRTELLRRLLQPWDVGADQGEHAFDVTLPEASTPGTLELSINCGPVGNAASDWTYWSNLLLSSSP